MPPSSRLALDERAHDRHERVDALLERQDDGDAELGPETIPILTQGLRRPMLAVQGHREGRGAIASDERDLVGQRRDPQAELLEPFVELARRSVLQDDTLRTSGEKELGTARAGGIPKRGLALEEDQIRARLPPARYDRMLELSGDEVVGNGVEDEAMGRALHPAGLAREDE